MTKNTASPEVECIGKEKMTAEQAQRAAKRRGSGGAQRSAYRCSSCGSWHVGHHLHKTVRRFR